MSITYNTSIVLNGLVFCLDAANQKSYSHSENFFNVSTPDVSYWQTATYATRTANAVTAPDGTSTGVKLVENTRNDYQVFYTTSPATAIPNMYYTNSIYAKSAGRTFAQIYAGGASAWLASAGPAARVDLSNGTLVAGSNNFPVTITPAANGWYRIASYGQANATGTSSGVLSLNVGSCANATSGVIYQGDGTSGIYVWGAQQNIGRVAPPLTQTTGTPITKSTTWTDPTKNGTTVTLNAYPFYNPNNGGYFEFNRALSQQATINPSNGLIYGSNPRTISCWMYVNSISAGQYYWGWSYGNTATSQGMFVGVNNTTVYFGGYGDDVTYAYTSLTPGTWFNLTGTYDGATAILYINGVEVNRGAKTWNTTSAYGYIGNQVNGSEYLDGGVAYASLYNRVLLASEVMQNFMALRGRYGV